MANLKELLAERDRLQQQLKQAEVAIAKYVDESIKFKFREGLSGRLNYLASYELKELVLLLVEQGYADAKNTNANHGVSTTICRAHNLIDRVLDKTNTPT